jgi:hypothetical protein
VLHKSKVTTTAPKAGDADLDAAENTDYNDNNHDDTETVTVKITDKQYFADNKMYIFFKIIYSYLVQTMKKVSTHNLKV